MPIGELFALGSAFTQSLVSLVDKALTRRLEPLIQAGLAALGGSAISFILLLIFDKLSVFQSVYVQYLLLGIAGGVTSFGIGFTLFLVFLKQVDASKAVPLAAGISAILSVSSGIFVLGETLSTLTLGGIALILCGLYLLSFSQRKVTDVGQAKWLGIRGMVFLIFAASCWVTGFSLQTIALREVDPLILNASRLPVIFVFLMLMSLIGVGKYLKPKGTALTKGPHIESNENCRKSDLPVGSTSVQSNMLCTTKKGIDIKMLVVPILNGSLGLGIGSLFTLIAIEKAGLAVAFTLSNTSLIWVTLLSPVFLKERLNHKVLLGVAVTVSGVTLVVL